MLHAQYLLGVGVVGYGVLASRSMEEILGEYLTKDVPKLKSAKSEESRVRAWMVLLNGLRAQDITIPFLEKYKSLRMKNERSTAEQNDAKSEPKATRYLDNLRHKRKDKGQGQAKEPRNGTMSSQTVRHELSVLRRALKAYCYRHELDSTDHPICKVKLPAQSPEKHRSFTDAEIDSILRNTDSTLLSLAIELLLETAMRRGELTGMLWEAPAACL